MYCLEGSLLWQKKWESLKKKTQPVIATGTTSTTIQVLQVLQVLQVPQVHPQKNSFSFN